MTRPALALCLLFFACESAGRRERPAVAADASPLSSARPATPDAARPLSSAAASTPASAGANGEEAPLPAAKASAETVAPGADRCRVALIGDSLTQSAVGGGYVRYLAGHCPESRFENFARGGAMVNQMDRQLAPGVLAEPAGAFTHLVVFGGVNDLYSDETAGRTPAKIEAGLSALYAAGKERGARVVAITVAPWGGFTKYFNPHRAAATRELNGWILAGTARGEVDVAVDAYALLSCGDPERLCPRYTLPKDDGLHFGKLGHEALGAALYAAEFRHCR